MADTEFGLYVSLNIQRMPTELRFYTHLQKKSDPFGLFIPLSGLLEQEDVDALQDSKIGHIIYLTGNYSRPQEPCDMVYESEFFPFQVNPLTRPRLVGKGIADKIQLFVAEQLLEGFGPKFKIMHVKHSDYRENQLTRLGISKNTTYPLNEYVKIIRSNVN